MTLKEFLEKYVYPTTTISVFVRRKISDDRYAWWWEDTVILEHVANDVLEGKIGSEFLNRKVVKVCAGRDYGLVIDVEGE